MIGHCAPSSSHARAKWEKKNKGGGDLEGHCGEGKAVFFFNGRKKIRGAETWRAIAAKARLFSILHIRDSGLKRSPIYIYIYIYIYI